MKNILRERPFSVVILYDEYIFLNSLNLQKMLYHDMYRYQDIK